LILAEGRIYICRAGGVAGAWGVGVGFCGVFIVK
jgi:hypothetical protein